MGMIKSIVVIVLCFVLISFDRYVLPLWCNIFIDVRWEFLKVEHGEISWKMVMAVCAFYVLVYPVVVLIISRIFRVEKNRYKYIFIGIFVFSVIYTGYAYTQLVYKNAMWIATRCGVLAAMAFAALGAYHSDFSDDADVSDSE
ncbi:hypothetical protein LJC23_06585 [Desulfovibrio sp. OttesenSCG-928-I05]|nr:hypothetical protein [Desulfovibrio sp. OttesenSCG-928-I05]